MAPEPAKYSRPNNWGSETESDFETIKSSKWRANESDSEREYRPVVFAPEKKVPAPKPAPVQDHRQTWQEREQMTRQQNTVTRPVFCNALETRNSMQMHEKSETNQRVVNMQSTHKLINYNTQLYGEPVPFPYTTPQSQENGFKQRLQPPPTPTKFVKGELRESDYESEFDSARIRPLWTPTPTDDPCYRPVNAPKRAASCPRSQQQMAPVVSPLVFDTQPPYEPKTVVQHHNISTSETRHSSTSSSAMRKVQSAAHEMTDRFRTHTQSFISNFEKDQQPGTRRETTQAAGAPQVYRDGSRVSEYGKSTIFY